jgi:hypothetical protein
MKRREFVASVLAGGVALPAMAAQNHEHQQVSGPLANATVSFGAWKSDPALDRFPNANPIAANLHELLPHETTIKAGGSVNFVIGGFHLVLVYGPGTEFEDINGGSTIPIPGAPMGFPRLSMIR